MIIPANESRCVFLFFFSPPKQPVSDRKTERLPHQSPHLPLIWLMHLFEIWALFRNHDNYWRNEEWQGSKSDVFITVVSDHRRHGCGGSTRDSRRDLTVHKSVCLKVNRSEEVPRPADPQVRLDISIYSLCPWQRHRWQMERENKRAGCTSDDPVGIFSATMTTWLNVSLKVSFFLCVWWLNVGCKLDSHFVEYNYLQS